MPSRDNVALGAEKWESKERQPFLIKRETALSKERGERIDVEKRYEVWDTAATDSEFGYVSERPFAT